MIPDNYSSTYLCTNFYVYLIPKSLRITLPNAEKKPAIPSCGFIGGFNPPPPIVLLDDDVEYAALVACLCNSSICELTVSNPSFLYFWICRSVCTATL